MKEDKNKKDQQKDNKPESNANATPMPKNYSNTANHKGAVDLGTKGTKATASQQQGQGAWNAKNSTGGESDNKK
jgi:hypothetical protein